VDCADAATTVEAVATPSGATLVSSAHSHRTWVSTAVGRAAVEQDVDIHLFQILSSSVCGLDSEPNMESEEASAMTPVELGAANAVSSCRWRGN